jgi:ubiquinone/menaquinone biosynthesis C-methylase UbiE
VRPAKAGTQQLVNSYFQRASRFWTEVYENDDEIALICQRRRDIALGWIDELDLPAGGRVLDVGCGAGLTSVELAARGFDIDATDTVPDMIQLTRRHGAQANVSARLRTTLGDVHALEFEDHTFDAAVALGVLPWLHSPQTAMYELARVLKPGAHLIFSANNAGRLTYVTDPRFNRALAPVRRSRLCQYLRPRLRRTPPGAPSQLHSLGEVDSMIVEAGFEKVRGQTLGFGPFTFLGRRVLPESLGVRLHGWLQERADRRVTALANRGAQYMVLARKPSDRAAVQP